MSAAQASNKPQNDPQQVLAPKAPWPLFRGDQRNSGWSAIQGQYNGSSPWHFQTGKGIFSTPVIDQNNRIYIGSADQTFYVLEASGEVAWKFPTGGVIDSAAALSAADPAIKMPAAVTLLSGDGRMYRLNAAVDELENSARLLWSFNAELRPGVSFNNWWEGNVAIGPDGTLYAGNTNFLYYAISPQGELRWTYPTGSNNWSMGAFGPDGTIYWGSNDTFVRAVSPQGQELWRRRTLGIIAASAAVGSDGTVYIGSFDSNLYALDPESGHIRWKFATGDHIYSSAALGGEAETTAIYVGSADGCLYALDPQGKLIWRFDTGAPIRSSPAIGATAENEEVVYFGCGNGYLYCLNTYDGSLRWAYDTTPEDPILQDRNDLNGSPALGKQGIAIGGEHGQVWWIPYDYPLHNPRDPRSRLEADELPRQFTGVLPVTPGASLLAEFPAEVSPATIFILRLVSRDQSKPTGARLCNNPIYCPPEALEVTVSPPFPFRVEHSGDGQYLYIIPKTFLAAEAVYQLEVRGRTYTGGLKIGNLRIGGKRSADFHSKFTIKTQNHRASWFPLRIGEQEVSAFEWTRLTAALPPMLPSLNQIGFDAMTWIVGTVLVTPMDPSGTGRIVLWAIEGQRDSAGMLVPKPDSPLRLPLSGTYQGDAFIVSNQNFDLPITGIQIPFNHFELRGRLNPDLSIQPKPVAFADTQVLGIPNFGPKMVLAGLANNWIQKLLVLGTYLTRPLPEYSQVHQQPPGVSVSRLTFQPPSRIKAGWIEATLRIQPSYSYSMQAHQAGILLISPQTVEAIPLNYAANLETITNAAGELEAVRLTLPRGTKLPSRFLCTVILDVFPIHRELLFLP